MSAASDYLAKLVAANPGLLQRGGIFRRAGVHESAEWNRIRSLPRRELDLDAVPDLTPLWAKPEGTMRLWPIQSAALLEAEACNGAFIAMPVGTGKTLTGALMVDALASKNAVLLVPPQLKRRTLDSAYPELLQHFNLPLDRLTVVSYSQLERAPGDVLLKLEPDLIIADEAHLLKHKDAARTARFLHYFKTHPDTRLVVMSGTLTQKSILDYAHLMKLALKERSPLPRDYPTLTEWSEALDVGDDRRPAGALLRLCEHKHDDTGRDHYRCILNSRTGVLVPSVGFEGVQLTIARRSIAVPQVVEEALQRLRKSWLVGGAEGPDGADQTEEVTDDLTFARYARQLACGFYLRWAWPDGVRDEEWLAARGRWSGAVRHVLRYRRVPGLDSPLLVANAASRGELAREHLDAWEAWCAVKTRPKPPTTCVWLSRYIVEDALRWLADGPGIVWYQHSPIGEEIAKALGTRTYAKASEIVADGRPHVLSMVQFGTGVDGLQGPYTRMLYTSVPNGKTFQQTLGRLHREGQNRPVRADLLLPCEESVTKLFNSRDEARYAQSTGFGSQKLLTATLEGIPDDGV